MEIDALKTLQSGVARALLNRRNSLSQTVMQGEMRKKLGSAGYNEALRQRWLVADSETGELQITNAHGHLENMRKLVEAAGPPAAIGDAVMVADGGKSYQGTVAQINPDGTYNVSFGAEKPDAVRPYSGAEIRKVATAQPVDPNNPSQALPAAKPGINTGAVIAGGEAGAAVGALGGPLDPVTVPLGAAAGAIAGGYLGRNR